MVADTPKPCILFFVTEDWYFLSHRLPLALEALSRGWDVHVLTKVNPQTPDISDYGIVVHPLDLNRSGLNPISDIKAIFDIQRVYRLVQPDIVHHVALKPVIYGTFAARTTSKTRIVNALAGLGFVFSGQSKKARSLRVMVRQQLRYALTRQGASAIVQNPDDAAVLARIDPRIVKQTRLIRGSGVDTEVFHPRPEIKNNTNTVVFALPARLNEDKGVSNFVGMARRLSTFPGARLRFALIGRPDPSNPSAVTETQLQAWEREGVVELWGHQKDMVAALHQVDVVVLPSTYGEGLPKSLLEAASCAIPVITTDTVGCREAVAHGETGLLVRPNDEVALDDAARLVAGDEDLRRVMGQAGREYVIKHFAIERVVEATFHVYGELLAKEGVPPLSE